MRKIIYAMPVIKFSQGIQVTEVTYDTKVKEATQGIEATKTIVITKSVVAIEVR